MEGRKNEQPPVNQEAEGSVDENGRIIIRLGSIEIIFIRGREGKPEEISRVDYASNRGKVIWLPDNAYATVMSKAKELAGIRNTAASAKQKKLFE